MPVCTLSPAAAPRGAGGQAAARASLLPLRAKMAGDEAGVTLGQPHLSRQDLATLVRPARGTPRGRGQVVACEDTEEQQMQAAGQGRAGC